ncbi:MAG: helix-turn-helix transcriptional regulator [Cellulomonas iranensis]|uniref:DNA-binding PadR family transcriptional regulator n=1 Tax=Cellulomonas iranensis TaxID=76862 RepID=A0ABU0GK25_9CELL|nr:MULTISPECIES: PadR family transcriptional regulator [Cellulomonas]MBO9568073.1 helix-turn-helix transcriptional regulator [Cellulomonas iranensis]MDQ0425274.1 DNA-binding PadR family transcriptional regulator [Cellulomonas iranensis]TFH71188.1 PadR family transcriptional regulator [Cellulomonas sp. HD19AZ1]
MSPGLQQPAFLVLSALAEGPLHGYGIVQAVAAASDGAVTLRIGTLYGALDRLAARGLVVVDREEVVDSRLRRTYRLTGEGERVLRAEAQTLRARAERALAALGRRSAPGADASDAGATA